jgi:hypothetical protein
VQATHDQKEVGVIEGPLHPHIDGEPNPFFGGSCFGIKHVGILLGKVESSFYF